MSILYDVNFVAATANAIVDATVVYPGWLEANKPPLLHLLITGRYAPQNLIDFADLVTEMRAIKHPFAEQGVRAQAGIEY